MATILAWGAPYDLIQTLRDGRHSVVVAESAWHAYCNARFSTAFDLVVFDGTAEKEITPLKLAQETTNDLILLSPAPLVSGLVKELEIHEALTHTAVVPLPFTVKNFAAAAKSFNVRI